MTASGRRIESTDPTYGRAASSPKPMRWAYDQDGKLQRTGHSEDENYLAN